MDPSWSIVARLVSVLDLIIIIIPVYGQDLLWSIMTQTLFLAGGRGWNPIAPLLEVFCDTQARVSFTLLIYCSKPDQGPWSWCDLLPGEVVILSSDIVRKY